MRINAIITLLIATMLILLLLASTATAQATRISAITERYLATTETSRVGPGNSAGTTASESPRPTLQTTPEPEPRREAAPKPAAVSRTAARPAPARYTIGELRRAIHRVAPNGWQGPQYADVSPRSAVWSHLTGEHGFTSQQVSGLTQGEALVLHDLAHAGKASPTRTRSAGVDRSHDTGLSLGVARGGTPRRSPAVPVIQSAAGCANGQCPISSPVRQRRGLFGRLFR